MTPKKRHPYLVLENDLAVITPRFLHMNKEGKLCGIYLNKQQPGGGTFRMSEQEFTRVKYVS